MAGGVHREPRDRRNASSRKHFSWLRSGTSDKSAPRKHSIFSHFPEDQNCEICQRTKITRAPCRRRAGDSVPRAEKNGDLITADHDVLNEGCESRYNHRHAVVVQDLATQWIQSCPCKTKTPQETERRKRTLANPVKVCHGSSYFDTPSIRDERDC